MNAVRFPHGTAAVPGWLRDAGPSDDTYRLPRFYRILLRFYTVVGFLRFWFTLNQNVRLLLRSLHGLRMNRHAAEHAFTTLYSCALMTPTFWTRLPGHTAFWFKTFQDCLYWDITGRSGSWTAAGHYRTLLPVRPSCHHPGVVVTPYPVR